jgi:mevalonate kinase
MAGMCITMQTDLLIGSGMGSSAAVVVSVLKAVEHCLQSFMAPEIFFKLAHQAESMQHGKSSGLDLHSSLRGGCLHFKEGQITARMPSTLPFYLIQTGQPQTTTGECVAAVANYFKNTHIGNDFADVAHAMDHALQSNHQQNLIQAVRENHKLLTRLGVVPEKVQKLIAEVENAGGGAKISGAGAVSGNHAGAVFIVMEDEAVLKKFSWHDQYAILPIQCEMQGVFVYGTH